MTEQNPLPSATAAAPPVAQPAPSAAFVEIPLAPLTAAPPMVKPGAPPILPVAARPGQPGKAGDPKKLGDANNPDELVPHINFWQTPLAQNVLPFATSFFLHVGIIILMIVLLPPLVKKLQNSTQKEETLVPIATLADDGDLGGIPHPGLGGDASRDAAQENDPDQKISQGLSEHKTTSLDPDSADGGGGNGGSDIALGAGMGAGRGTGTGGGTGSGLGVGTGGGEAQFGPRGGGGGLGPKGLFGGHGGNIHKLIFVCDGSGSMVGDKLEIVRQELMKEINRLKPVQSFNVLIFHETEDGKWMTMFSDHLELATTAAQSRLDDWVEDISANGDTDPLHALDEAFREGPQMIYLLTDGEFDNPEGPNNQQVLDYIRNLEKPKKVIISTRLFLKNDSEMKDVDKVSETLKTIADETGGSFAIKKATDF